MLEDFPLEILQRLICLVGSMGTRVVMQEQHWEVLNAPCKAYVKYVLLHYGCETFITATPASLNKVMPSQALRLTAAALKSTPKF
jgi:hypothetical protein